MWQFLPVLSGWNLDMNQVVHRCTSAKFCVVQVCLCFCRFSKLRRLIPSLHISVPGKTGFPSCCSKDLSDFNILLEDQGASHHSLLATSLHRALGTRKRPLAPGSGKQGLILRLHLLLSPKTINKLYAANTQGISCVEYQALTVT